MTTNRQGNTEEANLKEITVSSDADGNAISFTKFYSGKNCALDLTCVVDVHNGRNGKIDTD